MPAALRSPFELSGPVAIVTCANNGIGLAIAMTLAVSPFGAAVFAAP
jgi:NAD(P)-dependent dehydrogenase (short-subunit alcohol dehydrogenase family)